MTVHQILENARQNLVEELHTLISENPDGFNSDYSSIYDAVKDITDKISIIQNALNCLPMPAMPNVPAPVPLPWDEYMGMVERRDEQAAVAMAYILQIDVQLASKCTTHFMGVAAPGKILLFHHLSVNDQLCLIYEMFGVSGLEAIELQAALKLVI